MKIRDDIEATLPVRTGEIVTTENCYIGARVRSVSSGATGTIIREHHVLGATYVKWDSGIESGCHIRFYRRYDLTFL